MNSLYKTFHEDLEIIAENLILLFEIQFKKEVDHLSSPLLRWLDFRLRYIDQKPREIVLSQAFPKQLPASVEKGFIDIQNKIIQGEDINPYQSKTILRFHDISGKRKSKRTDLLWADWNISHLHITDIPLDNNAQFSERSCSDGESWVLFFIFDDACFCIVDIRRHNDTMIFSDNNLLRIINKSWPAYMEQFLLNGAMPDSEGFTSSELSTLRSHGINPLVVLDGKAYMSPGMGITSAATSTKVTKMAGELKYWVKNLADIAADPAGKIQQDIVEYNVQSPSIHLRYTPQGIVIYEATRNVVYMLSSSYEVTSHSDKMHDLLFPAWAIDKLASVGNSA